LRRLVDLTISLAVLIIACAALAPPVLADGACTYVVSPLSKAVSYKGGTVNIKIAAQGPTSSCPAPDIVPADDWITTANLKFSGTKGQVQLLVSAYDSSIARSGSASIGGNTFNVTQNGKPCALAVNAVSSDVFSRDGGTGDFIVTATPPDCPWQATPLPTSASWISITSGGSGIGTGDVAYVIGDFAGKSARQGKIAVVAGKKSKSFTVKQSHKPMLEGDPAFHASAVAGSQALGAGVAYPFAALQLGSPSNSLVHTLSAMIPHALVGSRAGLQAALTFSPELDLYTDGGILKGNVYTIGFFEDAAGTQPAGTAVLTLPADVTDPTDPTSYGTYPALVTAKINLTAGNVPCKGNVAISFTDDSGANSMTGTMTLTRTDVVFSLDLALASTFDVSGSITVKENGATLLLTNVMGVVSGPLTCDLTIDPYGWTGTGTIDLLTGALTANVETGAGTSSVSADDLQSLGIDYADGAQEIVIKPLAAGLTEGVTATSGAGQKAVTGTAFASSLVATVKDSDGNPVGGVTVTFTAPVSGASCSFAGGQTTAVTDASGVATSALVTANGTTGSYTVAATAVEAGTMAGFQLTNTAGGGGGGSGGVGFAYVANLFGDSGNFVGSVSQYSIGSDGKLTPLSPPTVTVGSEPSSVVVDPSGKHVYVANRGVGDGSVSQFAIATDGTLTPLSPATVATNTPYSVALDPSGKYAYATNWDDKTVSQFSIGADSTLAPLNPATVSAQQGLPVFVTVDPTGKYVYAASNSSGTIAQYAIGADGTLAPLNPPTLSVAPAPTSITVDPSGKWVYVGNIIGNAVLQFAIGADGTLAPLSPASALAVFGPTSIAVDPSGKHAYVVNDDGPNPTSVSQFTIGTDGTLTAMNPATAPAGSEPNCVTVDPSGKYVYATNYHDDSVSQYTIGADGTLTPMSPATVEAGISPVSVVTVSRPH
jgi:6-phosphogluconolactonase (cycloisomerase 2 family)